MNVAIPGAILPGCQGILTSHSCKMCFIYVIIVVAAGSDAAATYDAPHLDTNLYTFADYTAEQRVKLIREPERVRICVDGQEGDGGDTSR